MLIIQEREGKEFMVNRSDLAHGLISSTARYYKHFIKGLMRKLKLQYFGHLMRRVDSLEKILMLGGIGGRRRQGQ